MAYNESPHDQAGPGAMAVGVLESNPETKVALRLNDDGRLMVEVSGLAIDADIIDLDMDALTGAPPDNASLYDLWELMQIISGGTDLWNLENQLDAIRGTAELIDMDVLGVMDSLMAGSDLCDRVEAVHMAVEYLSGGVDLSVVDGDILRAADSLWVISSGDQVGLGDVWMAVDALGGGADLSLVDGDILRCADSLWAMTEGDAVSLGDVWLAVEALGGGADLSLVDGDILRCADSLWAMTEGDSVSLGDVWTGITGLGSPGVLDQIDLDILSVLGDLDALTNTGSLGIQDLLGAPPASLGDLHAKLAGGQLTFHAPVSVAQGAAGSTDLKAAVSGKVLRLHRLVGSLDAAGTIKVQSGGATDLTGAMALAANTPLEIAWCAQPDGCLKTAAGQKLNIVTTGGAFKGFAMTSQE